MVKAYQPTPIMDDGSLNIDSWLQNLKKNTNQSQFLHTEKAILEIKNVQSKNTATPENQILVYGLEMANTLSGLIQNDETLAAAILYHAVHLKFLPIETLKNNFSPTIFKLVEAAEQMDAFQSIYQMEEIASKDPEQIDRLRKMLLALVEDIRSILIKLAAQICVLRQAKLYPQEEQQKLANETVAIHAPLANRLGIGQMKWELEDLAFRYLAKKTYINIAKQLDEKRLQREAYIEDVIGTLNQAIKNETIEGFEVTGRVKHIFSIWKKMRRKDISFEEIYDIRAVRIIVSKVNDCYGALGVVHSLWNHIPKEFDDYIASPKQNGYQSLHTAVIGPEGNHLEIQIRTKQMHEESELGIAAHWKYKEGAKKQTDSYLEKRIQWLRKLIAWQDETTDDEQFIDEIRTEFIQDRVYVFTPRGEVMDLPMGSTPLDFAYNIHSEVGHRCRGAKINGKLVSLNQPLKSGEKVEILTGKDAKPSRDWLIVHNGYIHTNRARTHIHRWFKLLDFDKNLQDGKGLLDKELKKIGIKKVDLAALSNRFSFQDSEKFLAALGAGDLRVIQVLNAAQLLSGEKDINKIVLPVVSEKREINRNANDVQIYGVDNLLTVIAGCCQPVPGEPISGYITQGRGVSIHRQDCNNLKGLEKSSPERIIDVSWGKNTIENYPINLYIQASDRKDLMQDINKEIGNEPARLIGMNMNLNQQEQTIDINVTVEIRNLNDLGRLISKISNVRNVIHVSRQ
ncbi:MAG: GTP diphosphokinase [Deltaproteobacteria bacterium]|jgi:GTP pyrophosphokinase|nr:GTP diphosphokinase [Deltaproteobacteria bacterium]